MKNVFSIFVVMILLSCNTTRRLSNQNLAYMFTPGLNLVYPDYRACNISADTSRIFFRILSDELLFMKNDSSGSFSTSIGIFYKVFTDYDSKAAVDTGTLYFNYEQPSDSGAFLTGTFDVKAPDSMNYVVEINLTDFNRKHSVGNFVTLDRSGIQPSTDFLFLDAATNQPYILNYTDRELRLKILNANTERNKLYVRYFDGDYPLSPPPFSDNDLKPLSYRADVTTEMDLSENAEILIDKPGIYHFQFDTLIKEGATFFMFDEDFPRLTSAEELIESIRFLTTRQEFDKITQSSNKKQAVDNFWLELAGNRERARMLIRNYYSRVQLANRFFTSYLEGWKSDRGLVYIIFGPPASVFRSNTVEGWNYNQNYNYGPLNFTFDKIQNPFSDNDFKLRRSNYYEMPWYRAVDSWRDGRVVNDAY